MPARQYLFEDGSRITWKDRESILYEEDGFSALIWMDAERGFLRKGAILRQESIELWVDCPEGAKREISPAKKNEILEKVKKYYGRTPLRVA